MTTEALNDKWAEKIAEVKVETLVTLLPQIKAEALMNTLAARLTDVEIETLGETGLKIREGAEQQIGSRPKNDAYLDS